MKRLLLYSFVISTVILTVSAYAQTFDDFLTAISNFFKITGLATLSEEKTFAASKDAYVSGKTENVDKNFGSTSYNYVGTSSSLRTYIAFDTSSLPDDATTKASLCFYLYAKNTKVTDAKYINVYKVTEGWEESKITWNNQPKFADIATTRFQDTISSSPFCMNVATDVSTTGVSSWILKYEDESASSRSISLYSDEYANRVPYLKVTYSTEISDTTPPTISVSSIPTSPTIADDVIIMAEATDEQSNIASCQISIPVNGTVSQSKGLTYNGYILYSDLGTADSWARITIYKDGNKVDALTINKGESGKSAITNLEITLLDIKTEQGGTIQASISVIPIGGGNWQEMAAEDGSFDEKSETVKKSIGRFLIGEHKGWVKCKDVKENSKSISYSFTVGKSDAIAPTIEIELSPESPTTADEVEFTVSVSDNAGVDTESAALYVDGTKLTQSQAGTCAVASGGEGGGGGSTSPSSTQLTQCTFNFLGGPYSAGTHEYYATAKDTSDNSGREPAEGTNNFEVTQEVVETGPKITSFTCESISLKRAQCNLAVENFDSSKTYFLYVAGNQKDGEGQAIGATVFSDIATGEVTVIVVVSISNTYQLGAWGFEGTNPDVTDEALMFWKGDPVEVSIGAATGTPASGGSAGPGAAR